MFEHGYRCRKCHCKFDQPKETREGGYPEEPTYECPHCGSDEFEELYQCSVCGELFFDEDLVGTICKSCLEKARTTPNAFAYGAEYKYPVEINDFLAYVYSASEIEEILAAHFDSCSQEWRKRMTLDYFNDGDLGAFAEFVEAHHDDN